MTKNKEVFKVSNADNEGMLIMPKKRQSKFLNYYYKIGKIMPKNTESMDALKVITEFTKGEMVLLLIIRDLINSDNKVRIVRKQLTQAQRFQLAVAIPLWIKKGLIKRLKREYYVVNPYFITPDKNYQYPANDLWNDTE